MTAVLVDSNVLLDLMTEDLRWLTWSATAIEQAADRYRLVINPIIYAEVSVRYSQIEDLEDALGENTIEGDVENDVNAAGGIDKDVARSGTHRRGR